MNPTIFLVFLICGLHARPQGSLKEKDAVVLRSEFEQDFPNSYRFQYETSNGIAHGEIGEFEETGRFEGLLVKKGFFTYRGANNVQYTVTYVADDKGYRPKTHRTVLSPQTVANLEHTEVLKNANEEKLNVNDTLLEKHILVPDIDDDRIGTALLISLGGGSVG